MQVKISKDDTVILDGSGDKALEERAEQVCSICMMQFEHYVICALL